MIRTISTNDPRWRAYVRTHPAATAYHLPEWSEILSSAYRWSSAALGFERDGALVGVLPLLGKRGRVTGGRLRSLPMAPTAGPVGESPEVEAALLDAAVSLGAAYGLGLVVRSRRRGLERLSGTDAFPAAPSWVLDVPSDLEAWLRARSKRLSRGVRRAERDGVTVRLSESLDDLRRFYELYLVTMRKHHSPPRSFRQLSLMHALLSGDGIFRLFVAEHEGRIVSGGVWHDFNSTIELLYNASDPDALEHRPNHALYHHVLSWAADRGLARLDFGFAWPDSPLADFKAQWGAEQVAEVHYLPRASGGGAASEAEAEGAAPDPSGGPTTTERLMQAVAPVWDRTPLPVTAAVSTFGLRYL